jgi:hypothetical protein
MPHQIAGIDVHKKIWSRVNFFMKKFQRLGFIDYKNGLKVNNSLLTVVLHD